MNLHNYFILVAIITPSMNHVTFPKRGSHQLPTGVRSNILEGMSL